MVLSVVPDTSRPKRRYLREPVPLHFPVDEEVSESKLHQIILRRLWESVELALANTALVSCDQFMYWDPTDPGKRLAPDLAVRLGAPPLVLKTWKIWELGAPHLSVEVVSDSDASERNVEAKLSRYRHTGVLELARFDPADLAEPFRFWDLIDGDLVERDTTDPEARRCDTLGGLFWVVVPEAPFGPTLRLARDRVGHDLLLTPTEAARAQLAATQAAARTQADAAQARIAELEAALAKQR